MRFRRIGWALAAAAVAGGALIAVVAFGEGGASTPATSATVVPKQPISLAVGPNGDLYVADRGRQQILRRLPSGRFAVAAGTGVAGYSGDGGRATRAALDEPGSLAIAPNGALYFAQQGRTNTVVREVEPNGTISTVIGRDPNCAVVPANSVSVPAQSAELSGAQLSIGSGGRLEISTTVCPNVLQLGSFLRLTSSGELVQTPADAIPDTSGFCGGGVVGRGFIAFGCESGARRPARLMIIRSNGSTENYPDLVSQENAMAAANGTVVAIHNGAVVRVGVNGLETLATERRLLDRVAGATLHMGGGGIAIDRRGDVYVDQDFLVRRRGCTDVIVEIAPNRTLRTLWHSPPTGSCY